MPGALGYSLLFVKLNLCMRTPSLAFVFTVVGLFWHTEVGLFWCTRRLWHTQVLDAEHPDDQVEFLLLVDDNADSRCRKAQMLVYVIYIRTYEWDSGHALRI